MRAAVAAAAAADGSFGPSWEECERRKILTILIIGGHKCPKQFWMLAFL
jgi:hypothetical protein